MKIDTKANTLKKLSTIIKRSIVPKSYIFTVNEWQNKNKFITKKIKQLFNGKNIIIRSSTTSEDTKNSSLAGAFESILNIQVNNSKKINLSINQIINSYKSKILNVQSEQIFVQEMIHNIKMSGVIFTGDNFGYQDYYSINYDDITGRTDTVTSGSSEHSNKTLYIYKNKKNLIRSKRFKDLIKATEEIERHFLFPLDIEFCMTKKNKLYLLQVRPVVLQNNIIFSENEINKKLSIEFKKITKSFSKKIKGDLFGDYSFFSQMSDWNPAEMIGQFPSRLSHSLYSNLITDNSWIKAREAMGYKKIRDKKLMQNFAGRPFIDVRKSLNSFLPKNTPKVFGDKLINESIIRLKLFPAIHDKIEFELIPTCFSFSIKEKLRKLKFNSNRILKFLENNFIQMFSQNLKNDSPGSIEYNLKKIQVLNLKQKGLKYKLNFNLKNIIKILSETKKFGIVPFSILARHGFIAKDVLLSLKELKILNEKDIDNFMRSFSTITTEFLNDQTKLNKKKLSYKNFINMYGHLRAGTYDIKSGNYRSLGKKVLLNRNISKIIKPPKFFISNIKKKKIQRLLSQKKINLSTDELFLYLENSIKAREYSKFIFSKSINIILEKIKLFSKAKNIKLNDIEHLTINEILKLQNISKKNIINKISISKKNQSLNRRVKLPEIIVEKENAYIGASVVSTPNFVTDQNLTSKLLYLDNAAKQNLDNKIILLENADPGFDFIFSFKIKGLITKYGGVNSHMTIRCNELNIPAAIGCGDAIFTKLKKANKVNLNCKNYIIRIE